MVEEQHDMTGDPRGEVGTTLAELLVVIVLMGIVGTVTTAGIVAGFRAQLDASNVAETLDGMRLATQRVRDFAREADEVCASSTAKSLVLWTDDNDDGVATNSEKDIFELDDTVTPPVFQRRVPDSDEVQIIRDDILDDAIFVYDDDVLATEQPTDLACDSSLATGATSRVRSVKVTFIVNHPDEGGQDLTTSTRVRIRNADLLPEPNNAPVGDFTFDCPPGSQTCSFDASTSMDPDGTIASYTWEFGDGAIGSGVTTSHPYAVGDEDYDVTLLVVDNDGAVDTVTKTVRPGLLDGNARPVAKFTYACEGSVCGFDAGLSSDDGSIASYAWDFGDGTTATTVTVEGKDFTPDGTYPVTLVVTDDQGEASDPEIKSVVASQFAIRVESLDATISNKTNNYDVTFTIQLSRTNNLSPEDGIIVSVQLDGGKTRTDSCATDVTGKCSIEVKNVSNQATQSLSVTNLTDDSDTYTYDADQDKVDQIEVDKNNSQTRYKDGVGIS